MTDLAGARFAWVDAAKGLSIVLVVVHHAVSYLLVPGWVPAPVAAANEALASLRMPLFFLASGLFLAGPLAVPWRTLLHKRVAFFAYLYVLWTLIRFGFFATLIPPGVDPFDPADPVALAWALLLPGPSMWFLYALAVFSVIAKLARRAPTAPLLIASGVQSALAAAEVLNTGSRWEYMARFLFFFLLGWRARSLIELLARMTSPARVVAATVVCAGSAAATTALGVHGVPGVAFALNCMAVVFGILFTAWISGYRISGPLTALGQQTLPIYLIHMLWLAVIVAGLHQIPVPDGLPTLIAYPLPLVLTLAAIGLSLLTHQLLVMAGARWLFALPSRLAHRPVPDREHSPAPAGA